MLDFYQVSKFLIWLSKFILRDTNICFLLTESISRKRKIQTNKIQFCANFFYFLTFPKGFIHNYKNDKQSIMQVKNLIGSLPQV